MLSKWISLILALYGVAGFFIPVGHLSPYLTGMGLILSSIILIIKSLREKNYPILLVSIFMASYAIVPINYLFGKDLHIIRINEAENIYTVFLTSQCLLTFLSVFLLVHIFDRANKEKRNTVPLLIKNQLAFLISLCIALCCFLYGLSGENIFEGGSYYEGRGDRSSLYEYGIIFISLSLIYARNTYERIIVYTLCLAYIMKDLSYGGRITSLMLLFSVYMLRFLDKFKLKHILSFLIIGYIFFQFWGYFRADASGAGYIIGESDSNASFVFYASMRIHYLINSGILEVHNRLLSFLYFLSSTVIPYNKLPEIANLSSYLTSDYYSGGGGLISTFFYAWLWIPGIIIVAFCVAKVMGKFSSSSSFYWRFFSLLVFITTPRWFAYYPIHIIKYCLYGLLAFIIINKFTSRSKSKL